MTRERGAIAKVLNPEVLVNLGRKALTEKYGAEEVEAMQIGPGPTPQMIFTVDLKTAAVVNGEGTGHIETETGKIAVELSTPFSFFPVELDLGDLGEAVTETEIDLADGIRTFGSRLDVNHHLWFNRYEGK